MPAQRRMAGVRCKSSGDGLYGRTRGKVGRCGLSTGKTGDIVSGILCTILCGNVGGFHEVDVSAGVCWSRQLKSLIYSQCPGCLLAEYIFAQPSLFMSS